MKDKEINVEIDSRLATRIKLIDISKKYLGKNDLDIDTSYAKKALETHDIEDIKKAITEAEKYDRPIGKMFLKELKNFYREYAHENITSSIVEVNNEYDRYILRANVSQETSDIYLALEILEPVKESKEYKHHYKNLNKELEKRLGYNYETRPEELIEVTKNVENANISKNLAYMTTALEKLDKIIKDNPNEQLLPLYKNWYSEINENLKNTIGVTYEKIMEERNTKRNEFIQKELHIDNSSLINTINSLYDKKSETKKDEEIEYKDMIISTKDANSLNDMYIKYANEIEKEYDIKYERITRLMHDVKEQLDVSDLTKQELKEAADLRRAKYMFNESRTEYNTEDDHDEDTYNVILEKSKELTNLIVNRDIDFTKPQSVFKWIEKLVPLVNIQSVSPDLKTPVHDYILQILNNNGYTSERVSVNNIDSFYRNIISHQMKELEEYHFFVSEYDKSVNDNEKLTSLKVKEIAKLNYHKDLYHESERRLTHINRKLNILNEMRNETLNEYETIKANSEKDLAKLTTKLAEINDFTIKSKIYKTEEEEALKSLEDAKNNVGYATIRKMFTMIARLHDKDYKDKLLIAGYRILDESNEQGLITKKEYRQLEMDNYITGVKRKNVKVFIDRKEDLEDTLKELDGKLKEAYKEIDETTETLLKEKEKYEKKSLETKKILSETALSLKKKGYVDDNLELDKVDLDDKEEKTSILDKIKNIFNKKKKTEEVMVLIDEKDETLMEVVEVKKIRNIKENLYNTITNSDVRYKISNGLKYIREMMKSNIKEIAFFTASLMIVGLSLSKIDKPDTNKINTSIEEDNDKKIPEVPEIVVVTEDGMEIPLEEYKNKIETEKVIDEKTEKEEKKDDIETTLGTKTIDIRSVAEDAIDKTLTGENKVYRSVDRASLDKDSFATESLNKEKWENASVKNYYKYKNNTITQISEDEAQDLYDAGENVVISAENDDVIIGFTSIRK